MTVEAPTPAAASATPAAAAPATPATPAAPAAPAAAPVIDSLLPAADPAAPVAPAAAPAAPAVPPTAEWFYADGTPGKGEMPAWYLADKYKTVEEQAKAYPELAKRFGAFTGAPKDGKYEFVTPEGLGVELVKDAPIVQELEKWAAENQLSQVGYQHLLGKLAEYEASHLPNMNEIKGSLGANADDRINAASGWAKANMTPEAYQDFRIATSGKEAAAVFKTIEAVINKTRQVAMPKPGQDVQAAQPNGLAGIQAMMEKRDANGKLQYMTDPDYRAKVEKANMEYHKSIQAA